MKSYSHCVYTLIFVLCLTACAGQATLEPTPVPTALPPTATYLPPTPTPSAGELMAEGVELRDAGDFEQAVEVLSRALALEPQNPDLVLQRAVAYLELDDPENAQADIATVTELDLSGQDISFLIEQGDNFLMREEYDDASVLFDLALEIDPDSTAAMNGKAQVFANTNRVSRGMIECNRSLDRDPDNSKTYLIRAQIYELQGENEKAIADLEKSVELDPENPNTYCRMAGIFYKDSNYEQALPEYNHCIDLADQSYEAFVMRGNTYDFLGELDKAVADYSQAIQIDPDQSLAYTERGTAYRRNGNLELALQDLNHAIELDPTDYQAFLQRGKAYFFNGDWANAINDLSIAADAQSDDNYPRLLLSNAYLSNHQNDLALENLDLISEDDLDSGDRAWVRDINYGLENLPEESQLPQIDEKLVDPDIMLSQVGDQITVLQDAGDWVFVREPNGYAVPIPKGWYGFISEEYTITRFGHNQNDNVDFSSAMVEVFEDCTQSSEAPSTTPGGDSELSLYIQAMLADTPGASLIKKSKLQGAEFISFSLQDDDFMEYRAFVLGAPRENEGITIVTGNVESIELSTLSWNSVCTPDLLLASPPELWGDYEPIFRAIALNWYNPEGESIGVELPEVLLEEP
jgi:tetratricopeptide (TPR) repeat protein